MKICPTCQSLVIEDKCTNEKCGTGNHPPWHRNMKLLPKQSMTAKERADLRADMGKKNTKLILVTGKMSTVAVLEDGFTTTECSACGAKWDWEDPSQVKHCPECGVLVDWEGGQEDEENSNPSLGTGLHTDD